MPRRNIVFPNDWSSLAVSNGLKNGQVFRHPLSFLIIHSQTTAMKLLKGVVPDGSSKDLHFRLKS